MLNFSDVFTALNVTAVTNLLGTHGTDKALWASMLIPQDYKGKSINFYRADAVDLAMEWTLERWSINCRAETEGEAEAIAEAVVDQIHRKTFPGYWLKCSLLPTIPPADDADNFNCVVEATLKKR